MKWRVFTMKKMLVLAMLGAMGGKYGCNGFSRRFLCNWICAKSTDVAYTDTYVDVNVAYAEKSSRMYFPDRQCAGCAASRNGDEI